MSYETLLYDVRDGVATITLNRPDAANSMNLELSKELMDAALRCDEDPSVRAVIITGVGRMFSAGGDVKGFNMQGERLPYHLKEVTVYLHAAVSHFTRMGAPVIAAINGTAAGGGMGLVCCADIVLAAESARFTMAYTAAGLTPDMSTTYYLPRLVGMRRALELTLTNRVLSAQEALEWGLVTRIAPDIGLMEQAQELARQLASGPTLALKAAKRLLYNGWTESLETQMELESRSISDMGRTADTREGIAAFVEKRQPKYTGA
jgi:2-(1,2-epoxy-1,2-dihydrophenyl)acetyl-CoA isomerase